MIFDLRSPRSHYELLGVDNSVDAASLRKAFHQLSKTVHPDTTSLPKNEAAERFQALCEAYELLSDPNRRSAYDNELAERIDGREEFELSSTLRPASAKTRKVDVLRPFSGGELLSLVLLGLALSCCLLLSIIFAFLSGKDLQLLPSWLIVDETTISQEIQPISKDDIAAFSSDTIKSALINSF